MRIIRRFKGSSGRGWWLKYQTEGPAGFMRSKPPPAFDFDAAESEVKAKRSLCYFSLTVDGKAAGRVEFELVDELLPVTCANFKLLCSNKAPSGFGYRGSLFARRIVKDVGFLGGNVETAGGSHSAFGSRYFGDEGFFIPHGEPGILSMANAGVNTNGSQFYVTLNSAPHMDGRCVAFGRVVDGFDTLTKIREDVFTQKMKPVQTVLIEDCGVLRHTPSSDMLQTDI